MADLHPFERAGLGIYPFRCVGMEVRVGPIKLPNGIEVGAPGQPMGSCDYCGTGIRDCYVIRSADGKRFVVGCDCVRKVAKEVNDSTLSIDLRRQMQQVRDAKNEVKRKAQAERDAAKRAEVRAQFEARPELFRDQPHPNAWHASQGKTLRDYWEFCLKSGGATSVNALARAMGVSNV